MDGDAYINVKDISINLLNIKTEWEHSESLSHSDYARDAYNRCINDIESLVEALKVLHCSGEDA